MRTRGMTLLELMTALAVVALMLSMALVGIQRPIEGQREAAATRELWSSALRARQRALATNQPVRFVVEPNVTLPDGSQRTVARWERLKCENDWDNNTCPVAACVNTTCRANSDCCDEVGPDIVIPETMSAQAIHGLCYLPGVGRAVKPVAPATLLGCMQGQLDNAAALTAAAPGNLRFTFTSGRARSLLMVEPLTGLANVLDCDSKLADDRPVAECAAL
ncbi:prepilin-type N-terminal cleavage/methylation domain-containing protein [Myxococcus llanfairpwllgwyngyllgogerychwyrndrobwllllantysiliogogogochensis]|uniref:Prepilin-type N-terminal cleavage/methylation domain-containing protein n=1 Tax=Myxococcus llanfairpwllgwyngyllgogerychwyrndrobwllllantysiliogogogochensis TaxID=2590453 RepID=A0A540X0K8_9BACT|nr:prepilin-type N-terminal cleavage/methylation domain-containing protein [Myxococcus llanfairpwllgwyngyllgogerychwyrndrobwllllantysiliogogogochensis]TQF14254.1 prepilin-type N-terminal cleavage/methylation domain-containing protein [Myxococcus llanfairpwllgwyngyllgogerychwyrndrobwllllantysiliogogogochensis]